MAMLTENLPDKITLPAAEAAEFDEGVRVMLDGEGLAVEAGSSDWGVGKVYVPKVVTETYKVPVVSVAPFRDGYTYELKAAGTISKGDPVKPAAAGEVLAATSGNTAYGTAMTDGVDGGEVLVLAQPKFTV